MDAKMMEIIEILQNVEEFIPVSVNEWPGCTQSILNVDFETEVEITICLNQNGKSRKAKPKESRTSVFLLSFGE